MFFNNDKKEHDNRVRETMEEADRDFLSRGGSFAKDKKSKRKKKSPYQTKYYHW